MPTLRELILTAPPIFLALTVHEFSHAWTAWRFGDPTAKMLGRLSLNPLRHLDPIGTILLFVARFGWAKPVPVNPYNLRNPRRDMLWISLAGPASNVLQAAVFGFALRLMGMNWFFSYAVGDVGPEQAMGIMFYFAMIINVNLAVFNALPLHPLDGGKILAGLWPNASPAALAAFERTAPLVFFAVVMVDIVTNAGIFHAVFTPVDRFASHVLAGYSLI